MYNKPEDPADKLPANHDKVLSTLHTVIDALRRESLEEAIEHLSDAIAGIQNEIDWCYRTDTVLPFMLDYVQVLHSTVVNLAMADTTLRKPHIKTIIQELQTTLNEQSSIGAKAARWDTPDDTVDYLERQHRAQTYAKNT